MRKGLTLIELIFTMVIVAVTFTVIPKLIQTMGNAGAQTIKEDAIYNTMTLMGKIINLPWDQSNITSNAILHVNSENSKYECRANHYRIGGFKGGRNCVGEGNITTHNATNIGKEDANYDDIDDFDGVSLNTLTPCNNKLYDLGVEIEYDNGTVNNSTNIKYIKITTDYNSTFTRHDGSSCMVFDYWSYNIGQIDIKKRRWK